MLEKSLRIILSFLLKLLFGCRVNGIEHFAASGNRVIIAANHQSFLDPLLLAVLLPEKPAFVMNVFQAEKWYFRWIKKIVKLYVVDPSQPMSMKALISDLRKEVKVVIFPEGRITTSGAVMKIYDGVAMLINKTGATLLPVYIEGAQFSFLAKLKGKLPQRLFPKISLSFFPPIAANVQIPASSEYIYDIMTRCAFAAQNKNRSLLAALLEARKLFGKKHLIVCDVARQEMSYQSLITRCLILRRKLAPYLAAQKNAGILLPNSLAAVVSFFSLHALGKIPCMLNFSSGAQNIKHACHLAGIKTIITSRAFVEKAKLEELIAILSKEHMVIFLEDVRASISRSDKLAGAVAALFPKLALSRAIAYGKPYDPAVILYTSGSEGKPKGVALSHANILANIYQATSRIDLTSADRLFNALPVFHSFGLTIGMLLPILRGIYVFLYPSPLHYRVIPELIYDTDSTVMLGTDSFYQGYAHYANPYDFRSIRLAVAGAERLKETTKTLYAEKFGVSIMQGYGITETSPVLSCNTALYNKTGTVGRFFPEIKWRIEKIEGIEQGGRLFVSGPNVMLGYIKAENPGVIEPQGEWYDTGDIVDVDSSGYATILGRAKRFAKVGGEMISLTAVEELIAALFPDFSHAVISIPDERKGEQIVLFTTAEGLGRQHLVHGAQQHGFPEIGIPKQIIVIETIPILGSGKTDYPQLAALL